MRLRILTFTRWFILFLFVWVILSEAQGWTFGVLTAVGAAMISSSLPMRWPAVRLSRLPGFLGFFLPQLLGSGWDVARRALHPALPISPAWETYSMTSANPKVHQMLSALVGMLPGTLASHHHQRRLYLHILNRHHDWQATVIKLEQSLDGMLKEPDL